MITDDRRKLPRQVVEHDQLATLHAPLLEANRQVHDASLHHSASNVLDRAETRSQLSQKIPCFLGEMTSLLPGGGAEFPDSTDMIACLLPGGDAEFPDSIDMMASLLPGGDAEFPDSTEMGATKAFTNGTYADSPEGGRTVP